MESHKQDNTNLNDPKILYNINKATVFYSLGIIILIFVIIIFSIMLKLTPPKTDEISLSTTNAIGYTFLFLICLFLILLSSIIYLPILKDFKNFLLQIKNVTYVVIYTALLIVFFHLTPKAILNQYSIYTIGTILLAVIMFYKALQTNYVEEFNVNYERIKMVILFFCLIAIIITYYINDPGGYISTYFGYSLTLTIVTFVFIFLYIIILLTLPNNLKKTGEPGQSFSLLRSFTKFSVWGSISFIIFLIITTIYFSKYSDKFTADVSNTFDFSQQKIILVCVLVMVLLVCILWGILLIINLFPELNKNSTEEIGKFNFFKRGLLVLFGTIISALLITFIVYNFQHFSGSSSVVSIFLNLLLIVVLLALIYKIVVVKIPYGNAKKNAFFSLLFNIIFYIPCLFTDVFDFFMKVFIREYNTTKSSLFLLLLAFVLIILYFTLPYLFKKINLQGGKLLVNQPVYLDSNHSLGTYEDLNKNKEFSYKYAISFWFFLDANSKNTSTNYSILNYGEKPNVLYNFENNTLTITTINGNDNETTEDENDSTKEQTNSMADGVKILYTNNNVLLQKWNNIIINYSGGTMDIFLNGELVKSIPDIVPYHNLDNLTIGQSSGLNGGVCNVVYFDKTLTSTNIYLLYNMVKNFTPPILEDNNYTIINTTLKTSNN